MLLVDEICLQPDLVGTDRIVPVASVAASRDLDALKIVKPETVIRWHRAGFRAYWRWKSRPRGGRPTTPLEIRHLIREMSLANPFWGATASRRASQARHRCWANHRCKVYGERKATAVP